MTATSPRVLAAFERGGRGAPVSSGRGVHRAARRRPCAAALAVLLLGVAAPAAAQDARPEIAPKRLRATPRHDTPIVLDGRLDEAPWAAAEVGGDFIERDPYPGRHAEDFGVRTELRAVYDAETLYIAVTAFTQPGETPRGYERTRDSFQVFNDDAISLKIDVRLDQRTTVGFVTSPAGTQVDYLAVENGGEFRREFDAIWDVAVEVYEDRWVAEFALPFVALGLPGDPGEREIGFQVTRDHNARQSTYDWAEVPPQFGPVSALYYGRLTDLDGVAGGKPLTLIPYLLTGYDGFEDDATFKAGGDVRLRLATDTWGELTLLTDFAQVDLDDPVVNLNRFRLFFPERRPFFLTGLDVFDYGAAGFSQIFFTRRIGLDEEANEVPLLGGLKLYGTEGNFRFGVLQAVTGDTDEAAAANWTVTRVRYNFGERGHVGALATLQGNLPLLTSDDTLTPGGAFEPNWSAGVDGAVRSRDRKLQLSGFFAGTFNQPTADAEAPAPDDTVTGYSGQLSAQYLGLEVNPSVSVSFISEDFDPRVGFVARQDIVQARTNLYYIHRTQALNLRFVSLSINGQMEHRTSDGGYLGQRGEAFLSWEWDNATSAGVGVAAIEDVVQEDFEFGAADRLVEAGVYRGVQVDAGVSTPASRNPVGNFDYTYSSALFGGELHQFRVSGQVNFGAAGRLELGTQLNLLDFPDQSLRTAVTVNGKVVLTPSTQIALDLIGQTNTTEDEAIFLMRLRWRYLPGSDLFFVYREFLDFDEPDASNRTMALKVNYRFDLVL